MLITMPPTSTTLVAAPLQIHDSTNTPITITLQHHPDVDNNAMFCVPINPQNDRFSGLEITVETPMGDESDAVTLVEQYIHGLTCCFYMGWQWRASGHNYNSMSGHAFLVGANSNKILMRVCYSKACCSCRREISKKKKMEK